MGKTIFVSIPCFMDDSELFNTILSCFSNAKNPKNIKMGIAFIGDPIFYNNIKEKFEKFNNIKMQYYDFKNNYGVAKSRILARSMYAQEDYFLQIDAHALFEYGWDEYLINKFEKAKKEIKRE